MIQVHILWLKVYCVSGLCLDILFLTQRKRLKNSKMYHLDYDNVWYVMLFFLVNQFLTKKKWLKSSKMYQLDSDNCLENNWFITHVQLFLPPTCTNIHRNYTSNGCWNSQNRHSGHFPYIRRHHLVSPCHDFQIVILSKQILWNFASKN